MIENWPEVGVSAQIPLEEDVTSLRFTPSPPLSQTVHATGPTITVFNLPELLFGRTGVLHLCPAAGHFGTVVMRTVNF